MRGVSKRSAGMQNKKAKGVVLCVTLSVGKILTLQMAWSAVMDKLKKAGALFYS